MQNRSEILFQEGIENFKKKNFIQAEKCFEKLKTDYPKNKDILKNLFLCYFQNKKFKHCENVIKLMFDLLHLRFFSKSNLTLFLKAGIPPKNLIGS